MMEGMLLFVLVGLVCSLSSDEVRDRETPKLNVEREHIFLVGDKNRETAMQVCPCVTRCCRRSENPTISRQVNEPARFSVDCCGCVRCRNKPKRALLSFFSGFIKAVSNNVRVIPIPEMIRNFRRK